MTSLILMALSVLENVQQPKVVRHNDQVVVENRSVALSIDLKTGRYGLKWGSHAQVSNVKGEFRLKGGATIDTSSYERHLVSQEDVQTVKDSFGSGIRVTLRHQKAGTPEMRHVFWIYEDRAEAFVQLEIASEKKLESNYLAPIVSQSPVQFASKGSLHSLFVPFDNDDYVRYRSDNWGDESESCEVGAIYDNESRNGLVIGSIDHDLWKSGVQVRKKDGEAIRSLKAYAGATNKWTHDTQPHGYVSGEIIRSPRMLLGRYEDWRDGMERYGEINTTVSPALPWDGEVPFGWNSWSGHKNKLRANHVDAATNFFVKDIPGFRNEGVAYINLDSYWDNMKRPELEAFVKKAHAAGLKAGIYWTPFTCWGELDWKIGPNTEVLYRDIAIKDSEGKPLPKLDGGWPIDPTHPEAIARNRRYFQDFIDLGFDFVKLDFMSHGSLEGVYHDPKITTGVQAYRKGMQEIVDVFSPKKIGRPFFISLSIAPLFPHGFAHSRRTSCDAFARIDQTEYMLNSATYGWWTHGTLYRFNDPDHTVVYREHGQEKAVSEEEGRSRVTASVIGGGMLLQGDDLTDPLAEERVRKLFSNQAVLDVARKGVAFRPIDTKTPWTAANVFVWQSPDRKTTYVAVFNYDPAKSASETIDLVRLGLDSAKTYQAQELWSGTSSSQKGTMKVDLGPAASKLFKLTTP